VDGARLTDRRGQATPEYVGVVLLVAVLFAAVLATPIAGEGARIGRAVAERLVCIVRGSGECELSSDGLEMTFGPELAALARMHAPEIRFEDADYVSVPVDPRECRDRSCADTSARGPLGESYEGEPPTAFVRVIDCRAGGDPPPDADCSGDAAGRLYLQYWLYYPDSATRTFHRLGYHRDDWESYQVRIGDDGGADARASSHGSYNYEAGGLSDIGRKEILGLVTIDARRPGWGPENGYVWVSDGSHAGRAAGDDGYFRSVPRDDLRLVPIGPGTDGLEGLDFDPAVAPPWLKEVFRDPEAIGT
jgi:hypothetical protein